MGGYQKTTGKNYKSNTYRCVCGKIYEDTDSGKCPCCGSEMRSFYQQTMATLDDDIKQSNGDNNGC